jgi:ubiquinone/menaquinone biosynthesis C-methylase UbiE
MSTRMSTGMKSKDELATEQAEFWNGRGGQGWLAAYSRIDRSLAPFSEVLLKAAAARPGEHVIDIGCGTGRTTAVLAKAVGASGHVLAIDISEPLIEAARSHRVDNATFVLGDAATHPFQHRHYDMVFSRFGVMFFGDPERAFGSFAQALKPGGRLAFICWRAVQENPWGLATVRAAAPFLPPIPRPGPEDPGQYSFGDRSRVERILKAGGFRDASFEVVDRPVWMGATVSDIVEGSPRFGPLAAAFAEAAPEAAEKAKQAIADALQPHQGPDGVVMPGSCWLVRASVG